MQILQRAAENGREGQWRAALAAWLGGPYPTAAWLPSQPDNAIVPRALERQEASGTRAAAGLAGKDAGDNP